MTSDLIKKNLEEIGKKIDLVKSNIVKLNEQLEQSKADELQMIGAYQYANAMYQQLLKEEGDPKEMVDEKPDPKPETKEVPIKDVSKKK